MVLGEPVLRREKRASYSCFSCELDLRVNANRIKDRIESYWIILNFCTISRKFSGNFSKFYEISEHVIYFYYFWAHSRNSDKISSKFGWEIAVLMKNWIEFWFNSIFNFAKSVHDFWPKNWVWSGAKVCQSCRSRKMLQNEYLLAKFGFDTAENEPLKVCQKLE